MAVRVGFKLGVPRDSAVTAGNRRDLSRGNRGEIWARGTVWFPRVFIPCAVDVIHDT